MHATKTPREYREFEEFLQCPKCWSKLMVNVNNKKKPLTLFCPECEKNVEQNKAVQTIKYLLQKRSEVQDFVVQLVISVNGYLARSPNTKAFTIKQMNSHCEAKLNLQTIRKRLKVLREKDRRKKIRDKS